MTQTRSNATHTITVDQARAADEGGRTYLDRFVGLVVVFRTYEGEVKVGTVETMTDPAQPWGAPVIRFADGRWARGDSDLEVVNANVLAAATAVVAERSYARDADLARSARDLLIAGIVTGR